jgi:hypothetical protein
MRKSSKRNSPSRRSPKRKSPSRRSPKRKSPSRRSPKRGSPSRRSPKRGNKKVKMGFGDINFILEHFKNILTTMKEESYNIKSIKDVKKYYNFIKTQNDKYTESCEICDTETFCMELKFKLKSKVEKHWICIPDIINLQNPIGSSIIKKIGGFGVAVYDGLLVDDTYISKKNKRYKDIIAKEALDVVSSNYPDFFEEKLITDVTRSYM